MGVLVSLLALPDYESTRLRDNKWAVAGLWASLMLRSTTVNRQQTTDNGPLGGSRL